MFKFRVLAFVLAGAALLAGAFVSLYLQEFAGDEIPERARAAGIAVPLQDPKIEVDLDRFTLTLLDGDAPVKRYDIGFGKARSVGVLALAGCTPVGEYRIIRKAVREDVLNRGSRFLQIDYPNADDVFAGHRAGSIDGATAARFRLAEESGSPPPADTPLRGNLGIQGNFFGLRDRRFTDGSIALSNSDINELFSWVSVGTPVIIRNGP